MSSVMTVAVRGLQALRHIVGGAGSSAVCDSWTMYWDHSGVDRRAIVLDSVVARRCHRYLDA